MKKLTVLLFVLSFSLISFSQDKKDTLPPITEPIISVKQVNEFLSELKKVMHIEDLGLYDFILTQIQHKVDDGTIEWRKKLKKKN